MVNERDARALFEQYIAGGLAGCRQQVQAAGEQLPDAVRSQACHLLSFALRVPQLWPAVRELLLALDSPLQRAGYREQWLVYLQAGLACAEQAGDWPAAARLRLAAGELLRHLGQYDAAAAHFHAALAAWQIAGDVASAAAAKVRLGNLALLREEWAVARRWCQEVLDAAPAVDEVRVRALFVLAGVYVSCHESDDAERLYQAAETIGEALGDGRWVALCQQNRARLAARRGDYSAARSLYRAAHATFHNLDIPYNEAVVAMNWGIVEYTDGNLAAALAHYQAAEAVFRRLHDTRHLAMICNNIGLFYRACRQWPAAEAYYTESIRYWRQLGATLARISVEIDLGKLWLDRGDGALALDCFGRLLAELRLTERDAEHRRLYGELREYTAQAVQGMLAAQDVVQTGAEAGEPGGLDHPQDASNPPQLSAAIT